LINKIKAITKSVKYVLLDSIAILFSYLIVIWLFKLIGLEFSYKGIEVAIPIIIFAKISIYILLGVYRILTKHTGFEDIIKITSLIFITNLIIGFLIFIGHLEFLSPVALVFVSFLEVFGMVLPRILRRLYYYVMNKIKLIEKLGFNTLIIGAGGAAELAIKELYKNKKLNNLPVVILDDDPDKKGKQLMGIKILGGIDLLEKAIKDYRIEEVIIAIKDLSQEKFNNIVERLLSYQVLVKRINVYETINYNEEGSFLTEVKVEDLLNRDLIELDNAEIKNLIKDKVVLITGGGGSIGSELSRQIFKLEPKELVIFDIYENNAYDIQMELIRLTQKYPTNKYPKLTVRIGSVYNKTRLEEIFNEFKPEIVYHAAAYKHVPLMEDSAIEAFRTNVVGTLNCVTLSKNYGVSKFVLVSSDKAVRPTNIMGATKRLAEIIIEEAHEDNKTIFSAVRFGNVLESNGSVVPLFKKQIKDGGPLTVTHKDITRYFMTIPESVGLILQSSVYAKDGELFILDMGKPVKIYDLALKMIKLSGLRPNIDINIEIIGLRQGEKLYEELLIDTDNPDLHRTKNKLIFQEKISSSYNKDLLDKLLLTYDSLKSEEIKERVSKILNNYNYKNGI